MSFLLFFRGLVAVLVVFGVVTYLVTDSIWATLIQTAICAVLIQLGYFAAVLYMIWRTPHDAAATTGGEEKKLASNGLLGNENVSMGHEAGVPNASRQRQS